MGRIVASGRQSPNHPAGAYGRGYVLIHRGQFNQALADLEQALRLGPSHHSAQTGRCLAHAGVRRQS